MKRRGRPILGLFSGFFFGLFLGLTLLAFGVIPLESVLLVALPFIFMVLVFIVAMWAPIGGKTPAPTEVPQPAAADPAAPTDAPGPPDAT